MKKAWNYLTDGQIQNLDYSLLNLNQLVGVGTMALLSKQALTLTEIGRVTGGTVDKTPTRNQEQQPILNSSTVTNRAF